MARSILSISSPGVHFGDDQAARELTRHVNDAGATVARAHPDRFGHFASLPLPDVEGSLAELACALDDLGSDGVAVETSAGGIYLGDARYAPLYEELNRRRTVVFAHPTSPPCAEEVSLDRPRPMLEFIFDSTRAVSNLVFSGTLSRYPNIEWVSPTAAGRSRYWPTAWSCSAGLWPGRPTTNRACRNRWPGCGSTWPVPRFRARCRRWLTRSEPNACCTAATTAGPRPLASGSRPPPSTPQASPTVTRGAP